ncbi:amidohydrolase [Siminovitchia sediminis]|uniref:Amidohydrolase n=1 Tax=Siminovitchia sediminis TaxID=1274353 RepID=A0ABW4KNK5_9BACI
MNSTRIFINGNIFTVDPQNQTADAMVVPDGRIYWIGREKDMPAVEGKKIDLGGRRVLPGFIDAHLHPLMLAETSKQIACTPPNVHSIQDMVQSLKGLREQAGRDGWIEGWGYDEGKLRGGRTPNRHDLDQAAKDVPIVVTRTCTHIISVNSKALEIAGITKDTPNPPGGEIDRDEQGEPTGILRESAKDLVKSIIPSKSLGEKAEMLAEYSATFLKYGITGITEMMGDHKPIDHYDLYLTAAGKGLKQRVALYYNWEEFQRLDVSDPVLFDRTNPVYIAGIKLFADGSISGQTAWVNPAYLGEGKNNGISTTSDEELRAAGETAKKYGIQLAVHAMGEQAIDQVVNHFYQKADWLQDGPSVRVEHVSLPTGRAMQRAAESGIAFVTQPIFLYAEIESYLKSIGEERTRKSYPVKTMIEKGIQTAFSSDAPATAWSDPVNPFVGMEAAVNRQAYDGTDIGQDQQIPMETVIEMYTKAAREVTRMPQVGQLAPGCHADFVVLNNDLLASGIGDIRQICVEETYMGGVCVYRK